MRVEMKTLSSSAAGTRRPGDIVEVDEKEGQELIAGGFATLVGEDAPAAKVKTGEKPPAGKRATAPNDPKAK